MEFIGNIITGLEDLIQRNRWKVLWGVTSVLLVASLCMNALLLKELKETQELAQQATELYRDSVEYTAQLSRECLEYKTYIEDINNLAEATVEPTEADNPSPARTLEVTATAYCPCVKCCGVWSEAHPSRQGTDYVQRTSSGTRPTAGRTIATDPSVIPEGSLVILGDTAYVAEDTGSGVVGNHIDIYFPTHEEALAWGRQTVEVAILEKQAS